MYANVKWHHGLTFTGNAQSGFQVPLSSGDENTGFRPLELLAVGLAGCTGMDVISILEKKRQKVTDFQVNVDILERAEDYPKVWKRIKISYIVTGTKIDPAAVERAIELSRSKYCPASAMIATGTEIAHEYAIVEVEEGEALATPQ
ncbi:MAG: OsmC family protein [Anaerolineales bacterium]